jgi:hypothetical protein
MSPKYKLTKLPNFREENEETELVDAAAEAGLVDDGSLEYYSQVEDLENEMLEEKIRGFTEDDLQRDCLLFQAKFDQFRDPITTLKEEIETLDKSFGNSQSFSRRRLRVISRNLETLEYKYRKVIANYEEYLRYKFSSNYKRSREILTSDVHTLITEALRRLVGEKVEVIRLIPIINGIIQEVLESLASSSGGSSRRKRNKKTHKNKRSKKRNTRHRKSKK